MSLTLRIENYDFLEDGGPLEISTDGRPLMAGRDAASDWTLPDPARHVSSTHFEVYLDQGAYWLRDTSTNGTFLQGQTHRVESPYRLNHMDRLVVGHYIIVVLMGAPAQPGLDPAAAAPAAAPAIDPWAVGAEGGASAAPIDVTPQAGGGTPWQGDFGDNFIVNPAPPPTPAPPPAPAPVQAAEGFDAAQASRGATPATPAPAPAPSNNAVLRAFCEGAGLPPDAANNVDATELARELGKSMRVVAEELKALLGARAATKQFVKSGSRTMMGLTDNSPLKFLPDAIQALDTMYLTPREGYLGGPEAIAEAFGDIKRHQTAVYSAIQPALAQLLEDLSPESVESRAGGGLVGSKKAKAWEVYVERWDAKTHPYENGMLDVFLKYFAEAYDASIKASGGNQF